VGLANPLAPLPWIPAPLLGAEALTGGPNWEESEGRWAGRTSVTGCGAGGTGANWLGSETRSLGCMGKGSAVGGGVGLGEGAAATGGGVWVGVGLGTGVGGGGAAVGVAVG